MYRARRALTVTVAAGVVAAGAFATGMPGGARASVAPVATGSSVAAAKALTVTQAAFPLPLIVRGDRVRLRYEARNVPLVTGTLFVRNDRERRFTLLPLTHRRITSLTASSRPLTWLTAVVPDRLIRGQRLLYYAVIRDSRTGRSVTVPPAGVRAPETTLIINGAFRVSLGTHVFGHPQTPEAVVARADPTEVGFVLEGPGHGPASFDVGADRSVWLLDGVNSRVLVWAAGHPDAVTRRVGLTLPFFPIDFARGPAGSLYVTRGGRGMYVVRLSSIGKVLWERRLGTDIMNAQLRTGPDGTLWWTMPVSGDGAVRWTAVATPDGRPLSRAAQDRHTLERQPLPGGLQLARAYAGWARVASGDVFPHEARFALVNRAGRVVRAWRIRSRTSIFFPQSVTAGLVGADPVIVLQPTVITPPTVPGGDAVRKAEYVVLRLGPAGGIRARVTLAAADPPLSAFGDSALIMADLRVGPGSKLYQLGSSPDFGAAIYRYSLRRTNLHS